MGLISAVCIRCGAYHRPCSVPELAEDGWSEVATEDLTGRSWACEACADKLGEAEEEEEAEAVADDEKIVEDYLQLVWRLERRGAVSEELVHRINHYAATVLCAIQFPELRWDGSIWNNQLASPEVYEAL